MAMQFDIDLFNRQRQDILVNPRGLTFNERSREIERLRRENKKTKDPAIKKYIHQSLDMAMFYISIDTGQSMTVVKKWFKSNLRRGFVNLGAEVFLTIEYAEFCNTNGRTSEGMRALQKMNNRLSIIVADSPRGEPPYLLREVNQCILRLSK